MRLTILFSVLIIVTIILTALQLFGYQVLDSIIIMVIIDFIALGANIELEKRKTPEEAKSYVTTKLDNIEKICSDIFNHVTSAPNPDINKKLEKQKEDVSYILDKVAKKSLELEERIGKFGQTLGASVASLNERVKILETPEENKPEDQSFSVGEIIYTEDSDKEEKES